MFGVDEIVRSFTAIWQAKKFGEWGRLVLSVHFTVFLSDHFAHGTALTRGTPEPIATGIGLLTGAVLGYALLRVSPLTKGMMWIAPKGEAAAEMDTDKETTTRT